MLEQAGPNNEHGGAATMRAPGRSLGRFDLRLSLSFSANLEHTPREGQTIDSKNRQVCIT